MPKLPADQFTAMDAAVHIIGNAAWAIRNDQGEKWMEIAVMCAIGDRDMSELDAIEKYFVWWSRSGNDRHDTVKYRQACENIWPFLRDNEHLIPPRLLLAYFKKKELN
ncbi:MAG: hypothetical protein COB49_07515 [Alphaproteobacteria bacterium]|nr:MAG: hypothetical protein COB49_07515 [Alphaproteobacteria bacterium]